MGNCGCGHAAGVGPFAEGRELVEFVAQAHGGSLRTWELPGGGLSTTCQGCQTPFLLKTFVASCPSCGGVHAVSPPLRRSGQHPVCRGRLPPAKTAVIHPKTCTAGAPDLTFGAVRQGRHDDHHQRNGSHCHDLDTDSSRVLFRHPRRLAAQETAPCRPTFSVSPDGSEPGPVSPHARPVRLPVQGVNIRVAVPCATSLSS